MFVSLREESLPEGEPQVDELGTGPLPVSMPSHALNANPFLDVSSSCLVHLTFLDISSLYIVHLTFC